MHLARYGCWILGGYVTYKLFSIYFSEDLMERSLKERIIEEEKEVIELNKDLHELQSAAHSTRKAISRCEDELHIIKKLNKIHSDITVFCSSCDLCVLKMEVFDKKDDGFFIDDMIMKVDTTLSCKKLICHGVFYDLRRFDFYFDTSIPHPLLESIVTNVLTSYRVIERNQKISLKFLRGQLLNSQFVKAYNLDVIQGDADRELIPIQEVENRQVSIPQNHENHCEIVHYFKKYSHTFLKEKDAIEGDKFGKTLSLHFMESRLNHVSNALTKHKWNYENAVNQYEKYKQKKRVGITWSGILRATFDTQMAPTLWKIYDVILMPFKCFKYIISSLATVAYFLFFGCFNSFDPYACFSPYGPYSDLMRCGAVFGSTEPIKTSWIDSMPTFGMNYFKKKLLEITDYYVNADYY